MITMNSKQWIFYYYHNFCIFEFFRAGPGFSTRPAKNPARTRNSGSGPVSGLKFKSGPGSGFKIKCFSGSKKPGSKISGPGRPARCRALHLPEAMTRSPRERWPGNFNYWRTSLFYQCMKIKFNKKNFVFVQICLTSFTDNSNIRKHRKHLYRWKNCTVVSN